MDIGVPREIKNNEYRVGLVPSGARMLVNAGHKVFIQTKAGEGIGVSDDDYINAGAEIIPSAKITYDKAEMLVKVKEPLPEEYGLLHEDQILFTYLHLAPTRELTEALLKCKCIGVAYETVQLDDGSLPLLKPMSEVAGRAATQIGAYYLGKAQGGLGMLLGGVPGVERAKVAILGGGVVGTNAAKMAAGLGGDVYVLDISAERLTYLDDIFGSAIHTVMSNPDHVYNYVTNADLVVGAVLIPGKKAPWLVTRSMLADMKPGSVIVDVAIDQGGCCETSRATTHDDPVYEIDRVVHYCVANIPGNYARTSSYALTNVTMPYVMSIANKGIKRALTEDRALGRGLNVFRGGVTYPAVAEAMNCDCVRMSEATLET